MKWSIRVVKGIFAVKSFAWDFYDNCVEKSDIYKLVKLYINYYNNLVSECVAHIEEAKKGGMNYANNGDEFYTQEQNIVSELSHYDLNGKIIYCNCDNPTMSNFYKFFKQNFSKLGIRGLYATYYDENPKMFYFNGSKEISKPIASGRFQDNAAIMKSCDIVVTNPPFSDSMGSELVQMAKNLGKHVIIVGPLTLGLQKEMFEMIKQNQLNAGYTSINRFDTPSGKKKNAATSWWTTMPVNKAQFQTGKKYNPSDYPKYDNFDAIECGNYNNIPDDYYGYMGVSARFLRMLNRQQFDIIRTIKPKLNGKQLFQRIIIKRKQQLPNDNVVNAISEQIYQNLLSHHDNINESQGVVENGYDKFAEYLWERCQNNKIKPDRYGAVTFTIPSAQWNKYNTYQLSNPRIRVRIEDRADAWAAFSPNDETPTISINWNLLNHGKENFISKIMHELTHSVNALANLPNNQGSWNRMKSKLYRVGARNNSSPGNIEYLFKQTEMNARVTEAYYWLNGNKEKYIYQAKTTNKEDKVWFAQWIFKEIEPITHYEAMERYIKRIDSEEYDNYQTSINNQSKMYEKGSSLMAHLKFDGVNPRTDTEFPSFFKNKLKIKHYMQQQCTNFKVRIYKMIYKFMTDINIDQYFGEYKKWKEYKEYYKKP